VATVSSLPGSGLSLEPLRAEDVSAAYISWLNDPETMRYTESRYAKHTRESTQAYIRNTNADPAVWMWRIVLADGTHVGNIRLSAPQIAHRRGSLGIIIGEKNLRGKGIGPRAIDLVAAYAFGKLGIHKLNAGIYANNVASQRAFEKVGFKREAVLQDHYFIDGRYVDGIMMARFAP